MDDADVIRKTLRNLLKGEPAIRLLGEASNFAEAISMMAALKPDVVLLDLHMPEDHSFNPEFVKTNLSGVRVLAMSLQAITQAKRISDFLLKTLVQLGRWTRQSCAMN